LYDGSYIQVSLHISVANEQVRRFARYSADLNVIPLTIRHVDTIFLDLELQGMNLDLIEDGSKKLRNEVSPKIYPEICIVVGKQGYAVDSLVFMSAQHPPLKSVVNLFLTLLNVHIVSQQFSGILVMADPLSIAAGVLAILHASGKTARGLENAWQLRRRGQDFLDLQNQV
jgi:hypothetical protein